MGKGRIIKKFDCCGGVGFHSDYCDTKKNTQEKLQKAKRLMFEVTKERQAAKKLEADNHVCRCGHKRKDHSDSHSVNYTGGFCSKCDCENYLTNQKK